MIKQLKAKANEGAKDHTIELCSVAPERFLNIYSDYPGRKTQVSQLTAEDAKTLRDALIEIYPLPEKEPEAVMSEHEHLSSLGSEFFIVVDGKPSPILYRQTYEQSVKEAIAVRKANSGALVNIYQRVAAVVEEPAEALLPQVRVMGWCPYVVMMNGTAVTIRGASHVAVEEARRLQAIHPRAEIKVTMDIAHTVMPPEAEPSITVKTLAEIML